MNPKVTPQQQLHHHTNKFTNQRGLTLFEQWWRPAQEAKAQLVIIHGYAEHSSRYQHVGEFFARHGYAVGTFDLSGHGLSQGKTAYIDAFETYMQDVKDFLRQTSQALPDCPLFLLGHSMGGAIATLYTITRQPQINGLILSAAALKINEDTSPLLQKVAGFLGKVLPTLPTIKLDSSLISRDPAVVERYDNDPQIYRGGVISRTGAEILAATRHIQEKMEAINVPVLIMHGTADQITDPVGSEQLHQRATSADKTLKLYNGFYHEILNEPEKEAVMQDILEWMDARIE